ncbi:unnamed protein product [Leptidea sinapis]|uniref:SAC3/GANP/THP3 conserved domain-containing protein n=1 Tax=Leptidea sinapis TaxID=189913 RepID=A0A5E4QHW2_9NEOP|nr:unnamed protein product [Leptidea sinapis]
MNTKQLKTTVCKDNPVGCSISGTCSEMCPQTEKDLRIRERMINILETFQGEYKLVKCFSRSAADSKMAVPEILRPYPILKKTMHHLLHVVSKRTDVTTTTLYNFIDDRLRAVRQDMTIQRLPLQQCAELLEPMIRFYIYFAYSS